VANDEKHKGNKRKRRRRRGGAYDPVRGPRLRDSAAPKPAPEPSALSTRALPEVGSDDPAVFGEAAEDGLRMLAALEMISSLEPDFCDDLAAEASVTIIERATPYDVELPPLEQGSPEEGSTGSPRAEARKAPDVAAVEYAAYHGHVEEAVVEIFEGPVPTSTPSGPRRKKRRPVGHRFFKALADGGND